MKLWKSALRRAVGMALISMLLGGFLIYLYVPFFPFSTAKIFYYSMWDLEDEKQMKDWQRVPWDFGGFGTVNPQNPWTRYKVVYVKKGSIRPLSYWQRLEPLMQITCVKSAMCHILFGTQAEIGYGSVVFER